MTPILLTTIHCLCLYNELRGKTIASYPLGNCIATPRFIKASDPLCKVIFSFALKSIQSPLMLISHNGFLKYIFILFFIRFFIIKYKKVFIKMIREQHYYYNKYYYMICIN